MHPAKIVCVSPEDRVLADLAHPLATAAFAPTRRTTLPAVAELAGNATDVLVLDSRFAAPAWLRELRERSPRTSVMIAGGTAPLSDASIAMPVDPETLLATMRVMVRLASAHPAMREQYRQWSPAFDSLNDGLCLRDERDVVLRCNTAFAEAAGSTPLATAGRRIGTEDLLRTSALPAGVQLRGRWFRASLEHVRDGDGTAAGTLLVLADDSARTLYEQERERSLRDAAAQERERDEFLSVASHELRTPLTTVQLQVQALQLWASRADGPLDPVAIHEKLSKAEREVRRLIKLVADILDSAKLDRGRVELHPEETDLAAIVRDVVSRFTDRMTSSGSRVTVDAPEPVVGFWDRVRIEQVVNNLLVNALLYGRGRPIDVSVTASPSRARLEVRDQGIGIAAEDQQRIFKRFARATHDRSLPGFGMGLWSTRRILDAMGGDVTVESEPGVGSTFVVELPLAPARAP